MSTNGGNPTGMPMMNGNPFMSMNNYSSGVGQISATGAVIKFFTTNGAATVRSTGQAGVGLFFEREMHDGSFFPVIKDITHKGSAYREGTIKSGEILISVDGKSCRGMSLVEIKSSVMGTIGTVADLMLLRSDNSQRLVKLSRAPVEYWVLYDANVEWKTKYETLRDKNKENENQAFKYKNLSEDLQKTMTTLDQSVETMRAELMKQRELARSLGSQNSSLAMEKKNLENSMDNMLKKISEITLHFKSAEALAREMTEKARQSEGSRQNESQIRKMSEDREANMKTELISEVQRRRVVEQQASQQADNIVELEDRVQVARVAEMENKRLHGEILILRTDADCAKADFESALAGKNKYEAEMIKEQKQVAVTLAELELLKKSMIDLKDTTETAKNQSQKAVAEKDLTLVREQELVAQTQKTSATLSEIETKNTKLEAELSNLKIQIESEQNKVRVAIAAKAVAVQAKEDMETAVQMLKQEIEHLKSSMESFTNEAAISVKALEDGLTRAQNETTKQSKQHTDATAAAATAKDALEKQVRAATEACNKMTADATASETNVAAALVEMERLKELIKGFEASVSKAQTDASVANDALLKMTVTVLGLEAQVKKLESDAAARCKDLEAQKTLTSKEASENKAAKTGYAKIEKELTEVRAMLSKSESAAKDLDVLGKTWEEKCKELEKQLAERQAAGKENATMGGKVSTVEHELTGLKEETKRLQDTESTHLKLLNETVKKYEELMQKYTTEVMQLKTDYEERIRTFQNEYDYCNQDRIEVHTELARFLAMANPCGVGIALVEAKEKGQANKSITVGGMKDGLSADLSGIIRAGDELIQVNEFICDDMTLADIQTKVAGNRGTQVAFRFRRKIEEGQHKGETFDYRIVLKRGAWGPEHTCMTPEDLDMIDVGRWPAVGSVSAETVDMENITNGQNLSLNYTGIDAPIAGRSASAVSKGAELAAKHGIRLMGLEEMNKKWRGVNSNVPPKKK